MMKISRNPLKLEQFGKGKTSWMKSFDRNWLNIEDLKIYKLKYFFKVAFKNLYTEHFIYAKILKAKK